MVMVVGTGSEIVEGELPATEVKMLVIPVVEGELPPTWVKLLFTAPDEGALPPTEVKLLVTSGATEETSMEVTSRGGKNTELTPEPLLGKNTEVTAPGDASRVVVGTDVIVVGCPSAETLLKKMDFTDPEDWGAPPTDVNTLVGPSAVVGTEKNELETWDLPTWVKLLDTPPVAAACDTVTVLGLPSPAVVDSDSGVPPTDVNTLVGTEKKELETWDPPTWVKLLDTPPVAAACDTVMVVGLPSPAVVERFSSGIALPER